jgi:hypothetical protein
MTVDNGRALRGVWLAIILLASMVAGIACGGVFSLLGDAPIAALTAGGAVFVGVATLGLAAHQFMKD